MVRFRDLIIWCTCLLVSCSLLIIGGMQLDYINSQRQQMRLISNEPLENAPPSLAFATVAMGAFRGLVVDILWMRAERLKEEGQFFDAKQLADWITKLQPRFASVWDFQSWNMAYNISVAIPSTQPEERWRWVKNGYELLRDQGIPLNPKSILLYRQLAFIFQHKIGAVSDDAHKYYKLQLAEMMEPLLGPADNEYFEALAKAPQSWEEIRRDANVAGLIDELASADKTLAQAGPDDFVNQYLSLRQNPDRFAAAAFNVIDSHVGAAALKKFDTFAKAYYLRHVWKLDPVLMEELNKTYGPVDWNDPNKSLPLDWRHPDSHAIYWAVKGLRVAGKKSADKAGEDQYSIDEINTDRIVNQSLQSLFRAGKIYIWNEPAKGGPAVPSHGSPGLSKDIFLRPDLRMFEPYNRHVLKVIEKYTDPNEQQLNSHQIGHRNMLENAVLSFYQSGHERQAGRIYTQLRNLYPQPEFEVPLVVFARNRFLEELKSLHILNAREIVPMLLRESYFYYAMRDDNEATAREKLAQEVWDFYMGPQDAEYRIDLPPMPRLRYVALIDFLNDQQYLPSIRMALRNRIKIERPELFEQLMQEEKRLQEELKQSKP
ncbi:MAG TPA: hypothetical protein VMX13_03090 [Sedimentisphaerales bacterium]|nr:hypothetical protein [Sedimentisphaerales bacterium]